MADISLDDRDDIRVREVDPFSYWEERASAIRGFGGERASPDPRYCLHTHYLDVAPGTAYYRIHMTGVTASRGQLDIRVHALKIEGGSDAQFLGSRKLELAGLDHAVLDGAVRFTALEGVRYAFFAYFLEASDILAEQVRVTLEEVPGTVPVRANRGQATMSRMARAKYAVSHRLVSPTGPSLKLPLSQPFMRDRMGQVPTGPGFTDLADAGVDPVHRWELSATLRALGLAGGDSSGAHGLLVQCTLPGLEEALRDHGIDLDQVRLADGVAAGSDHYGEQHQGTYDFIVSYALYHTVADAQEWLRAVGAGLGCLCGRGVAVFMMPFWTGLSHDPRPPEASSCLDRNAVQQIALRLIGQSYSVAQLAFPHAPEGGGEITSFILIAHKLA